MKKTKKFRGLGIGLTLAITAFWLAFYWDNGIFPWAYTPPSLGIFRIWDGLFFLPWVWLLRLAYPKPERRVTVTRHLSDELKQAYLKMGLFAGVAWQLFFTFIAYAEPLYWWYAELGTAYLALTMAAVVFSGRMPWLMGYGKENSPNVILGLALGIALGGLITVGIYVGAIGLIGALIVISVFKPEES